MIPPHCDSFVLHAPGECKYCDDCPESQEYRQSAGINFSGHRDPYKAPCPSTNSRSEETVNLWRGNKAQKATESNADLSV